MAYITIEGAKYEKELIELAEKHVTGMNEGKIAKDEAADLIKSAKDGVNITDIEKATLRYIRKNYEFTVAAAFYFDAEVNAL